VSHSEPHTHRGNSVSGENGLASKAFTPFQQFISNKMILRIPRHEQYVTVTMVNYLGMLLKNLNVVGRLLCLKAASEG